MHPDDAPGGEDDLGGDGDDITRISKMPKVSGSTVQLYNAGRGDVEHETLLLKANENELQVSVSHARPFVPVRRLDDSATSAVAGHEDVMKERESGEQLGRVESNEGERDADCNASADSCTRLEQVEQAIFREEEARIASRLNDLRVSAEEEELMCHATDQLEGGLFDEEQEDQLTHVRARVAACDLRFTLASLRGVAVSDVKPLLLAAGRMID
jgi:hypothetical protein